MHLYRYIKFDVVSRPVNGVELFLLGRTLMKLGEDALPTDGLGPQPGSTRTVLVVLVDLAEHGESSVGDIVKRTGLPQSQVSTAVARLRDAERVDTEPDPADRRRVLIRLRADPSPRALAVASSSIDATIAKALGDEDEVEAVVASLEALAARLVGPVRQTGSRDHRNPDTG
jgi:DNA-binding MarR family transcriptional regulator